MIDRITPGLFADIYLFGALYLVRVICAGMDAPGFTSLSTLLQILVGRVAGTG